MNDHLRLNRVRVQNLFGRFSYDINFNNGYNVAILIAPNGCGKTTIFNLMSCIFNPTISNYKDIEKVPFDFCECTLSNGHIVTLRRNIIEHKSSLPSKRGRTASLYSPKTPNETVEITIDTNDPSDPKSKNSLSLTDTVSRFSSNDRQDFLYSDDFSSADFDQDDLDIHPLPMQTFRKVGSSSSDSDSFGYSEFVESFLAFEDCFLDANYIRADRLQNIPSDRHPASRKSHIPTHDPLHLIKYQTKKMYKEILTAYNILQSEMKDRLPKRYLDSTEATMTKEQFIQRWEMYVSNIKKYYDIGLLSSAQTILDLERLDEAYDKRSVFLTIYLEAFEKTLEPLEKYYVRLKLFADILNRRNRVTRKVITYGENGVIITVDGKQLPLEYMSSGEKNDLIMFYNLIFNSKENGIVLIDEPEISLHIEWQEEYLDCLLHICEMNDLQAVVATHSPNIVNGHFELYAERGLTDGC